MSAVLDWGTLVPIPDVHDCECRYCEQQGEQEPADWPMLLRLLQGGVEYITDRYLLIKADLAPIPSDYPGIANAPSEMPSLLSGNGDVTDSPANGRFFRWQIIKAITDTGWRLRTIEGSQKKFAVIDRNGEVVGVAMASRDRDPEEHWAWSDTHEYDEDALNEEWANRAERARELAAGET